MKTQSYIIFIISVVLIGFVGGIGADTTVERNKTQTYIVDRTGERWDVTQAITLGFKPEKFHHGIVRNVFSPLDDSNLSMVTNAGVDHTFFYYSNICNDLGWPMLVSDWSSKKTFPSIQEI